MLDDTRNKIKRAYPVVLSLPVCGKGINPLRAWVPESRVKTRKLCIVVLAK